MRQFTILRRNIEAGGDQQFLVVFSRPSDVARTTFLVDKHPGGDDDRWLYLPGLDLLKRIASGDKRTSFVGSTFFYEDISGRDINADNFELLSEDDSAWTLKATPKDAASVEFAYYTVKIDKKTMLPMLSDYFDSAGKNYRRMSATKVKDIQGFPTIMEMKAENLRDGSFSINQLRKAQYDVNIPENVFSERSLRMPPRAWVKL
ncbi:MAG: outer membrane lipoprotein-sorting protein, partial [Cellvibrionaceae bacterium]|nr:outer membrane lipoprotein-sorting protein [Cellvibrionaceae bacterium]